MNKDLQKKIIVIIAFLFIGLNLNAQNVGVNSTGAIPATDAILDISSADKGLLIPRVSIPNLTLIGPITPGAGTVSLLVYNTNGATGLGYYYWDGADWIKFLEGTVDIKIDNGLYYNAGADMIRLGGPLVENTTVTQAGFGMTWNLNGTGDFNIQDNGTTTFRVLDDGTTDFGDDVDWRDGSTAGTLLMRFVDDGNDGRLRIYENGATSVDLDANTQFVFNEQGLDRNFRVESNNQLNMFFVDAGTDNIGMGTGTPDASALLELNSSSKGFLATRVALTATNAAGPITTPATGLLVYNTATAGAAPNNVSPGYYYWDGVEWVAFGGSGGKDWSLLGNAGTAVGTNFIGTTDANSFAFRTSNIEWMRLRGDGIMTVNSGGGAFPMSTFFSAAAGNDNAIDGNAGGSGSGVYGQQTGSGNAVYGLTIGVGVGVYGITTNPVGYAVRGINVAAAGSAIGFGGFFASSQTGGTGLVGSLGSNSYFGGAAISAYTETGAYGFIAHNDNANAIATQVQTGTSTTTIGILALANNANRGINAVSAQINAPSQNGTGYGSTTSNAASVGQIAGSRTYSFGILGTNTSTARRTGGVIGISPIVGRWGALGYRAQNNTVYGAYITTAGGTGGGAGKMAGPSEKTAIGIGAYGDLMGQWVKGNVYGMNVKGDRYGLYVDGKTYTNNIIAQVFETPNGKKRNVSYVSTSTTVDVMDRGMNQLSNGQVYIPFSSSFSSMVSSTKPIMVTVTPNGATNGVYVTSITNNGFTVVENNNGTSNTQITWMAIATRAGYENPENPVELLSKQYDANLNNVMHNENDKTETAKRMIWNGSSLQFDDGGNANTTVTNVVKEYKSASSATSNRPLEGEKKVNYINK
ncbi:MAG: hypothetical protein COB15_03485 [Flavobacteriales bacterium]|nr:MAG: hypothetical protein COB15_03485 [Flavobacteriales bacterium]